MEDAITIVPSFMKLPCTAVGGCRASYCKYADEDSSVHYFGLFDGHGGAQVTNGHHRFGNFLCASLLHCYILTRGPYSCHFHCYKYICCRKSNFPLISLPPSLSIFQFSL